jgi:hypothetical protein
MVKPPLRAAGFMSGSGSNLRRLLEYPDPAFEVCFLFSDNAASQARQLALDYNLPCFIYGIRTFYAKLKYPRAIRARVKNYYLAEPEKAETGFFLGERRGKASSFFNWSKFFSITFLPWRAGWKGKQ